MKPLHRLAAWIAFGVIVLSAGAWVPIGVDQWPDGPVHISFGRTPSMPAGGFNWDEALREAAGRWNGSLQRIRLEVVPPGDRVWYENERNEVFFDRMIFDDPFPGGVLAVTTFTYDRDTLIESDIIVNPAYSWDVYAGPWRRDASRTADFRRVMVHELGHLLGLGHPDENNQQHAAIMNSTAGDIEAPTTDDTTGAKALYDHGPGAVPTVLEQPVAATVKQGNAARLRVLAGGRGPLSYQWKREGVPVSGATRTIWEFTAGLTDDGEYTVDIVNAAGLVTSKAVRLTVTPARAPRTFSLSGPHAAVHAGTDVRFRVNFEGDAPIHFEWRKNGIRLDAPDLQMLDLADVQFSDEGEYTVTVSNAAGSSTSEKVRLTVIPPHLLRQTRQLPTLSLAPGARWSLSAPVQDFVFAYQWYKDGVPLPEQRSSSLEIASFGPQDAGRYTVVVSSSFGSFTSTAAELMGYPWSDFTIVQQPTGAGVNVGEDVVFRVELDSPATTYQWFRNGLPMAPSNRWEGTNGSTLTLHKVGFDAAAVYSVEASKGSLQLRSQDVTLKVFAAQQPVTFRAQPAAHSVLAGEPVALSVDVYPPASNARYQWLKNGVPIPDATRASYHTVASATEAGAYRVRYSSETVTAETEDAVVEVVSERRIFSTHPASRTYILGTEELRLTLVADEVARRRAEGSGNVYFYSQNGQQVASPYSGSELRPGTYTLTRSDGARVETSRPFTLAVIPSTSQVIMQRQPRGGAFAPGESVELDVAATGENLMFSWTHVETGSPVGSGPTLRLSPFAPRHAGTYVVKVSNGSHSVTSDRTTVSLRGLETPLILTHPVGGTVVEGGAIDLNVVARGNVTYQWHKDGRAIAGATHAQLVLTVGVGDAGSYTVAISDSRESAMSRPALVQVLAAGRAPEILAQSSGASAVVGGDATLSVNADGGQPPTRYQWFKDGVAILGANDARLRLRNVAGNAGGNYTVEIANASGRATSRPMTLTVDARARLVNLATRSAVGLGGDILIAGFTLSGAEKRTLLIRGIGDQLSEFGVNGVLRDPIVKVLDAKAKVLISNDDWWRAGDAVIDEMQTAARRVGAFPHRARTRDAAVIVTLEPGSYTAQVSGFVDTTGVGLVEIYELGKPTAGRLINLSSRAMVGADANILIPGFVLSGGTARRVVVRAIGPGLADFGVAGALNDPMLKVFRDAERIAENDNWGEGPYASGLPAAMGSVGAFPLKTGSRDAAVLLELLPGNYTVQVAGVAGTMGIALVEVYELP